MAIASTMQTCSIPFKNVSQIGTIPTLPQTPQHKNINDLLEYYGKLEQQEAKRKPKTCHQDNSKLQQQPARNQNQCRQGNQNQCNGNNRRNKESFCSYHQLHGHSDAECRDPRNPKGVNANSFPPSLFTLKSNQTPSLSMDAHSLFQKPMKA
jgi:hypothetical protein